MSQLSNEILLNIRKNNKLSRKGLENLSGFKERTIMSYERGERPPSEHYITFIGLYFDVNIEYIKGFKSKSTKYTPFKKTILMYQDIYNYTDKEMSNILGFKGNEVFYKKVLDWDISNIQERNTPLIIEILEYLNIKPSCIGLITPSLASYEPIKEHNSLNKEIVKELNKQNEPFHNERINKLDKHINILEKKGIELNKEYYANAIKSRNLAKENYTPISKAPKLDNKYQAILDLLPYASDSFLEDITSKLQAMKDIQKL